MDNWSTEPIRKLAHEVMSQLNYPEANGCDGLLHYFTSRFPNLVLAAWRCGTYFRHGNLASYYPVRLLIDSTEQLLQS